LCLKKFLNPGRNRKILITDKFHKKDKNIRTWGLHNHKEFWDLVVSERLLSVLRNLLGKDILYLYNSHVEDNDNNNEEYAWHRDNTTRIFGKGADWNPKEEYNVIRVGFYLSSFEIAKSGINIIPGSHKKRYTFSQLLRLILFKTKNIKNSFIKKIVNKLIKYIGVNIKTNPGDCVMFLANVFHTPIPASGLRKSVFSTYGTNNKYAKNYNNYYLKHRNYPVDNDVHEEFKNLLTEKNIYIAPPEKKEEIEGVT
jgi:hypothetical protein